MTISVSDLNSYDWQEAFANAAESIVSVDNAPTTHFSVDDVTKIISADEGENDELDWVGVFQLRDNRYVFVSAGCDYTGWG